MPSNDRPVEIKSLLEYLSASVLPTGMNRGEEASGTQPNEFYLSNRAMAPGVGWPGSRSVGRRRTDRSVGRSWSALNSFLWIRSGRPYSSVSFKCIYFTLEIPNLKSSPFKANSILCGFYIAWRSIEVYKMGLFLASRYKQLVQCSSDAAVNDRNVGMCAYSDVGRHASGTQRGFWPKLIQAFGLGRNLNNTNSVSQSLGAHHWP